MIWSAHQCTIKALFFWKAIGVKLHLLSFAHGLESRARFQMECAFARFCCHERPTATSSETVRIGMTKMTKFNFCSKAYVPLDGLLVHTGSECIRKDCSHQDLRGFHHFQSYRRVVFRRGNDLCWRRKHFKHVYSRPYQHCPMHQVSIQVQSRSYIALITSS